MFVGDSLTIGHWETTLQAMAHGRPPYNSGSNGCPPGGIDDTAQDSWHLTRTYDFCADAGELPFNVSYMCHNHVLAGYVPSTTPALLTSPQWIAHTNRLRDLDATRGLVLVVNRGAWTRDDNLVAAGMYEMMRFVREDLPRTLFIFRSSNMAHGNCRSFQRPIARGEPLPEPSIAGGDASWRWDFFPAQSRRIVAPIVSDERYAARGVFLDVLPAMQQRPDAHSGDCLHYCIPGPVDQWVRWVYAIVAEVDRVGEVY